MTNSAADSLPRSALAPTYAPLPFAIVRGEGDRIFDADGEAYIDLYGGHCVCSTGHGHPRVVAAIREQAGRFLFYSNAVTIPIRDEAARRLTRFAPQGFDSVFFCNSGAEATENALKIAAMQTGRRRLVGFEGGFHGRTPFALAAGGLGHYAEPFEGMLPPHSHLPFGDIEALERADLSDAAAVIVEPIQSMAGVRTAPRAWFEALRAACDRAGAMLIFDEIQTGMGRLGAPFAANLYGVRPDMICLAKGLASGVPAGAVLMTAAVANRLAVGDLGTTFGGGPLACAAIIATLDVIEEEDLVRRAKRVGERLRRELEGSAITRLHGEGLLLGLELPGRAKEFKEHLLARHIIVGGSSDPDVLRLMPPLTVTDASIDAFVTAARALDAR